MAAEGWTIIILAGQRPGTDPLASAFGQEWKALVRVAGMPMLDRVLGTVLDAPFARRIVVLSQAPGELKRGSPAHGADPRITWLESSSGISESIRRVAGTPDAPWPVLVTTADHPLLSRAMLAEFAAGIGDADVAVAMVERATILARYPETKRTWLRFRGGAWSGANLFAFRTPAAANALTLWAGAEQDRKQALRLFWHFGPRLALRAISRTISLPAALERAGKRIGVRARLVPLSFAEAAIDVDKPADHALVETILARQA